MINAVRTTTEKIRMTADHRIEFIDFDLGSTKSIITTT